MLAANYAANNREIGGVIPTIKLITTEEVYEVPSLWMQTKGNYPIMPSIIKQQNLQHSPLEIPKPVATAAMNVLPPEQLTQRLAQLENEIQK